MAKTTNDVIENAAGESADVRILNLPGQLDDLSQAEDLLGVGDQTADGDPAHSMEIVSEDMAAAILATPFSVAAAFLGDHWKLSRGELDLMAPPAARVFTQLFGRYCSQYPDAYMLGFALCTSIGTRVAMTVSAQKQEKPVKAASAKAAAPVPDMRAASAPEKAADARIYDGLMGIEE